MASIWIGSAVAVIVAQAVALVLIHLGLSWPRFVVAGLVAIDLVLKLSQGIVSVGVLLPVIAAVLLILPPAGEYFAAKRQQRAERRARRGPTVV